MKIFIKILEILVLLILFDVLIISSCVFLDTHYGCVEELMKEYLDFAVPYFQQLKGYLAQYKIPSWAGLILTLVLVSIYCHVKSLKHKEEKKSKVRLVLLLILLIVSGGAFGTIYFWKHDIIEIGKHFTFYRGPKEIFLKNSIHWAILGSIGTLSLYLIINLLKCLFGKTKPEPKENLESNDR